MWSLAFVLALGTTAMARPLPECGGGGIPCAPVHWFISHRTLGASHGLTIFGLHGFFTHPRPLGECPGVSVPCP
jgi:hypothetical protein